MSTMMELGGKFLSASALLFFFSAEAFSQVDNDRLLSGAIYLEQSFVDNATGVRDGQDSISERQSEYGLLLQSDWESELLALELDYDASKTQFQKNTQADDSVVDGASEFVVGNDSTFYGLRLAHSNRRFIVDPDVSSVLRSNVSEREIISATPDLRMSIGAANRLSLAYKYVDVSLDGDVNDSVRKGLEFLYARQGSSKYTLELRLSDEDIDFAVADTADYSLSSALISLRGGGRVIDYSFSYGTSQAKLFDGSELSRPVVDANIGAQLGNSVFTLFASRRLSDTSQGDGNDSFFAEDLSFDGGTQGLDQIDRLSAGVQWSSTLGCARCRFSLAYGLEEDDFISIIANSTEQSFVNFGLRYQVNPRLALTFNGRNSDTTFTNDNTRADSDSSIKQFGLNYLINVHFRADLRVGRRAQGAEGVADITVDTTDLSVRYTFD